VTLVGVRSPVGRHWVVSSPWLLGMLLSWIFMPKRLCGQVLCPLGWYLNSIAYMVTNFPSCQTVGQSGHPILQEGCHFCTSLSTSLSGKPRHHQNQSCERLCRGTALGFDISPVSDDLNVSSQAHLPCYLLW